MHTINSFLLTLLLALAVKQLSYALMQGSMFEPLRKWIRKGMRQNTLGFETLSELFSCKLCMTMQVSLWCVVLPGIILGHYVGIVHMLLGGNMAGFASTAFLVLGSFLYGMSVSGIALAMWIMLEYPAKRYEDLALQLHNANERIADLEMLAAVEVTEYNPSKPEE